MNEPNATHQCMLCTNQLLTCTHAFKGYDHGNQEWCSKCGATRFMYDKENPLLPLIYVYCQACLKRRVHDRLDSNED